MSFLLYFRAACAIAVSFRPTAKDPETLHAVPWNDEIFRRVVDDAARRVGKSRTQVLVEAGISKSTLAQIPRHGRGVELIERLMPALEWGPADALSAISQSFGWGNDAMKSARASKGLRETLESISEAARQLSETLPIDDGTASLDSVLALVGALVRAREGRGEDRPRGE